MISLRHRRWELPHVPALDGLRGVAVAGVLLYHAGYLEGGYLGVDLFFVLSGYLITSLLLVERVSTEHVDLGGFWGRRARRLLPALYVFLVGVAAYAAIWARPIDLPQIRGDAVAALLYVSNWRNILASTDYWAISKAPSPLQHLWSLAIEEQFYLVWPAVLLLATRGRAPGAVARRVAVLAAVGATLSLGSFAWLRLSGASATRIYEGTDTRAFAVLCGALLACWMRWEAMEGRPLFGGRLRGAVTYAAPIAAFLLGIAWFFLPGRSALVYQGGLPACSVLAALVLAGTVLPGGVPVLDPALRSWPARKLGHISYGTYLWHWPIYLVLTAPRTGISGPALLALRLAVTLAVAIASYLVVEMPIRHGLLRPELARPAIPVCMSLIVLLFVTVTVDGVTTAEINAVGARAKADVVVDGVPKVMFLGDSVAASLADYGVADPKAFGANVYDGAAIGCGITYEGNRVKGNEGAITRPKGCSHTWKALADREQPDVVVVLFGAIPESSVEVDGAFRAPCDPRYTELLQGRLVDRARELAAPGRAVLLATMARSTNGFRSSVADRNVACWNEAVRGAAQAAPAGLLDLSAYLCPQDRCRTTLDGASVRPDSLHFFGRGGAAVARWAYRKALAAAQAAG